MISLLKKLLATTALIFTFASALNAGEFHAILIGVMTEDIAPGVRHNIKKMKAEVERMAEFSGQHLQLALFQGENATLQNVKDYTYNLQVGPDDVIFFYQSSHGVRPTGYEGNWPFLCYDDVNIAVALEGIHDYLKSKNPRLLISMADACNNVVEGISMIDEDKLPEEVIRAKQISKGPDINIMKQCYTKLFLESRGIIMASASQPGDVCWYIVKRSPFLEKGGLFTLSLIQSFRMAAEGKIESDWEKILLKTQKLTMKKAKWVEEEQKPQFLIHQE